MGNTIRTNDKSFNSPDSWDEQSTKLKERLSALAEADLKFETDKGNVSVKITPHKQPKKHE